MEFSHHGISELVYNGAAAQSSGGGGVRKAVIALVNWWECAAIDEF